MFSTNHFIWLGISLLVIVCFLVITKYKKITFDNVLTFMFFMALISELIKMFSNMKDGEHGGMYLDPGDLPLHLCSIQIFFITALKFFVKKEDNKEKLLGFMVPTMLVGAFIALFIPTVGVKFNKAQVYQFFMFHAFVIAFAIYVLINKMVNYTWKTFFRNVGYLGALAMICMWMNSILYNSFPLVNFMYLVRPPMENLPILNLNNGWYVYFITVISIALSFMFLFNLIVMLIYKKKRMIEE